MIVPGFSHLAYDFKDQMVGSARQVVSEGSTPETTYYIYNTAGRRVRKVTEAAAVAGQEGAPPILRETMYLDDLDITTKYRAGVPTKERTNLRIRLGTAVVAIQETLTEAGQSPRKPLMRYQLTGHLPSVSVELSDDAKVISYEEYSPFGTTTLLATAAELGVRKRYRFSGMERDRETGLLYFGRRYLCAAAARWTTSDPIGLADGLNTWAYVGNDPVNHVDPTGLMKGQAQGQQQAPVAVNNVSHSAGHPVGYLWTCRYGAKLTWPPQLQQRMRVFNFFRNITPYAVFAVRTAFDAPRIPEPRALADK